MCRLTCVFLATKTENFPISIDSFSARVKTPPVEILSLEFLVSQSLKFEYKVHHAHLALNGILLDLQVSACFLFRALCALRDFSAHSKHNVVVDRHVRTSTRQRYHLQSRKLSLTFVLLVILPPNSSTLPPTLLSPVYTSSQLI